MGAKYSLDTNAFSIELENRVIFLEFYRYQINMIRMYKLKE